MNTNIRELKRRRASKCSGTRRLKISSKTSKLRSKRLFISCRSSNGSFQKRIGDQDCRLETSTMERSPLAIANAIEKVDPAAYLPKPLANRGDNVTDVQLNYRFERNKTFCTYTVKWEEATASENAEKNRQDAKSAPKQPTKTKKSEIYGTGFNYQDLFLPSVNGSETSESKRDAQLDEFLKNKAPRASNSSLNFRSCHGPCKKMRPVENLQIIGLCEHTICDTCLDEAPIILSSLGGSGCPNNKCFLSDVAALCPDPGSRHLKYQHLLHGVPPKDSYCSIPIPLGINSKPLASSSSVSNYETDQIVLLTINLYEKGRGGKNRFRECEAAEFSTKETLNAACRFILGKNKAEKLKMENILQRTYSSQNRTKSPEKWTKLTSKDWQKKLLQLVDDEGNVHLVVDYAREV